MGPLSAPGLGPGRRFPRQLRLLNPQEFRHVLSAGCRLGVGEFVLAASPSPNQHPRLGLAISKKHVKSAYLRNRIKRQLRESFRLHQEQLGAIDVVVLARSGLAEADLHALRRRVDLAWPTLRNRCGGS